MIGHASASPLRACVKVADYYDISSTGTLICVKTLEMCVESAFVTPSDRFSIADCFFGFGEDN
jgi:hypothetical protein